MGTTPERGETLGADREQEPKTARFCQARMLAYRVLSGQALRLGIEVLGVVL